MKTSIEYSKASENVDSLKALFNPQSIALIGATEKPESVGLTLFQNLKAGGWKGKFYPVNPKRNSVLGVKAFPNIGAIGAAIDLAVIATPAATVPGILAECAAVKVKGAIIISAGFKEAGPEGIKLEAQIMEEARKGSIRLIGPNCLGLMLPPIGLNATFAEAMAATGRVAFLSQSGALCTAILDWSAAENVGFSAFISTGSMADVGWGDLIEYLGDDPQTESIVIYMESVGDAPSFMKAAGRVTQTKPIIVIKAGRTEAAAKAAASHTGSLTGSDEVLNVAFRRAGVLRVDRIAELFYMAEVLAKQPRPQGPRLTILTNAGGPGVLATDSLVSSGGTLAPISEATLKELNQALPEAWSHHNPIDILGDADPNRYAKALEIALRDKNSDGLLVILTPQAMTEPTPTAESLARLCITDKKPILASWMGGPMIAPGDAILNKAKIPTFPYPDTAARVFQYMWQYSENLAELQESLSAASTVGADFRPRENVGSILEKAKGEGRTILTEVESKQILSTYQIPVVETQVAFSEEEAVEKAVKIGFPLALKVYSETITHKSDVGGVKLNLKDEGEVHEAYRAIQKSVTEKCGAKSFLGVSLQAMVTQGGYELILGSSFDPQFGPVILFGSGGILVEVYRDRALGLPPLNAALARRLMEQTRIYKALLGVRGKKPVDLAALENILVHFSELVLEQKAIKEIDINPLLASEKGIVALDGRIILQDPKISLATLPKPAALLS
jgi:acetyltransferase